MRPLRTSFLVASIAAMPFVAGCSHASDNTPDTEPPVASVTLTTGHAQTVGTALATGAGLVLYSTAREARGRLSCDAACESGWPSLTVTSKTAIHLAKSSPVRANLIGTVKAPGAGFVVTYGGYPLHTYSGDTAATSGNGEGIDGFYVVTVSGTLAKPPAP